MRLVRAAQTSWTAGEMAPALLARVEVSRYHAGAALLRNVLVQPQGGLRRRPGMRHLTELSGGTDGVKLLPFAFNTEQTYCIGLTDETFRVWKADGTLVATVTGCPWTGDQAAQMNMTQSADTLLLFHADLPPQRIKRGGSHSSWTRDTPTLSNIPTHDFGAVTVAGTIAASATSGTGITLTASVATFTADMVGWTAEGSDGVARITAYTSGTQVTATVTDAFASTSATSGWTLAEPVISTARGWPECGTFHQGRLYLGGLKSRPATFIASKVADFFNFDQGTGLDDEGLYATIDSDQVNAIHQMGSGRALLLMTAGAEFAIAVSPVTPKTLAVIEQTRRGIKRYVPLVEVDGATLFVQRGGAALRQFVYDDIEQAWRADLLSLLAPHLIRDPSGLCARKGASGDDADHVLLPLPDGAVTVLTTLRAQEVAAFSRWETDGTILSAAALASGEVFFAVLRAGTVRVELWDEDALMDASTRQTSASPFASLSGLDHLDGLTVGILLDGAWQGTDTVTGGALTLPREALAAEVGLPFDVRVQTLPLEPRDPTGNLIGRRSRIRKVTARVKDTGLFEVQGRAVVFRRLGSAPGDPLDGAPPVVTEDVHIAGLTGWRERNQVEISQSQPAPFNLLALAHEAAIET